MIRRLVLAALIAAALAPLARADTGDETPVAPDPTRPAVGDWTGHVSWNSPLVTYSWRMNPDASFSSGRLGRSQLGGGQWNAHGTHATLKYSDGFRYEGEISGDTYSGTAYRRDGRAFGGFSMSRDVKGPGDFEEAPN